MIVAPRDFQPLLAPVEAPQVHTFVFRRAELLVREHPTPALAEPTALRGLPLERDRMLPVGLWQDAYWRTTWVDAEAAAPEGHAFRGLRSLFGRFDDALVAIAGRAFQIADWARTHRFCGACGQPMRHVPGERAMQCACGHTAYPRVAPAMMALVKRGDAILLARNIAVPPGGRMSALAGFVEPGEGVEDTVRREVREEVGLEVDDLRYFGSQSWPFPHSLMIAFTAEYAGGEIRCDPNEIAEARWYGPSDPLPELSPAFSISRALIEANLPRR